MLNLPLIFIVSLGLIAFSLLSKRLRKTIITLPMVFVIFGFLLGPYAFHVADFNVEHAFIHGLAEITLVLVLYTDAARIDLRQLFREHNIPIRLLMVGLPLTILLGTFVGKLFFGSTFTVIECAILATILAPTDAVLSLAVITNSNVPMRIRQAINIESGLNDGLVLPVIFILIAISGMQVQTTTVRYWADFIGGQLLLSPLIGVIIGWIGGYLILLSKKKFWILHSFQDLSVMALSLLAYSISQLLHANGFIAAFFAGLTLGNYFRELCECLYDFSEAEGQLLILFTFLIFGAV